MFKVGDKVKIIGISKNYIGGIINHATEKFKKDVFDGLILFTSSYWENELEGEIMFIGKDDYYIIRKASSRNDYYVFCNDYNEMELIR
jgi:hypothetical protein